MITEIKTIFFDLFGVLLGRDETAIVRYFSGKLSIPYLTAREIVTGENYMRLARNEIDFNTYYQNLMYAVDHPELIDRNEFLRRFRQQKMGILPAVNILPDLYARYDLHIISNTVNRHIESLRSKFLFFQYFQSVITSEDAGFHKPHSGIFKYAMINTGASPGESLFIDDASANVRSAVQSDMHGYHYSNYEKFEKFIRDYR